MDVKSTWTRSWHPMDHVHGHLDHYFQKSPLEGRSNTKPRDHGTPNAHHHWFILFYHVWGHSHESKFNEIAFGWGPNHIWLHTTLEDPWPHYMMLEVCGDGLWTLSFELSQSHGHGSWLMCEVANSQLHIIYFNHNIQNLRPTSRR
jgi:hypothetical protein